MVKILRESAISISLGSTHATGATMMISSARSRTSSAICHRSTSCSWESCISTSITSCVSCSWESWWVVCVSEVHCDFLLTPKSLDIIKRLKWRDCYFFAVSLWSSCTIFSHSTTFLWYPSSSFLQVLVTDDTCVYLHDTLVIIFWMRNVLHIWISKNIRESIDMIRVNMYPIIDRQSGYIWKIEGYTERSMPS